MGEDYKPCKFFENVYKDFCPKFWVEKWDELVAEGRFPGKDSLTTFFIVLFSAKFDR
jgi:hypothetical protein